MCPSIDQTPIDVPPLRAGSPVGTLGRMRDFFSRQYRTKTGKASMTTVVATGAAVIAGTLTPAAALTPMLLAVLAMLMHDGEAKRQKQQRDSGE